MFDNKLFYLLAITAILLASNCFATKDSDCPLTVTSDHAELDEEHGTTTYTGNVIARQGSRELKSAKLVIKRNKTNTIELVTATGNPAKFQAQLNPDKAINFGQAEQIKYYPLEEKIFLINNAELIQESDTIKGQFLTYYFTSGLLTSTENSSERTTVILNRKSPSNSANEK